MIHIMTGYIYNERQMINDPLQQRVLYEHPFSKFHHNKSSIPQQDSYKAKAAARRTTRPPTLPPTLVAAPVKTGMFEPVGLAMVPLTGMEVNWGATTAEALETAERVTMLALEEVLDGQGLTITVELAAMDELWCHRVRVIHNKSGSFPICQERTYAAVGIIAAAGAEEAMDMGAAELLAVTGQTVVETAMVLVTTMVEWAGHDVTVGAQLVMVISWVE